MTVEKPGRRLKLTVFLMKVGASKVSDFVIADGLHVVDLKSDGEHIGTLLYRGGYKATPQWVDIFRNTPGFDSKKIVSQSSKALVAVEVGDRWFCFTFGHARHLINDLAYERNFGLIVALNLGDPRAIKSIEKMNISHISLHSREQAAREIEFSGFEFDKEIDLLRSVTAKLPSEDSDSRETVSGRDSITIHTTVTVDALPAIARRLYRAFKKTTYKKWYPWIDNVREERDASLIDQLDSLVVDRINNGDTAKIWLAIPEIVSWPEIVGFAYRIGAQGPKKPGPVWYKDLGIDDWIASSGLAGGVTVRKLHGRKVYVGWEDGRQPTSWSVYRCLNAEISYQSQVYVLNDAVWYCIEPNYVQEVQDFFKSLPDSSINLPPYGAGTEPAYLARVAKEVPAFALMDRKLIAIGGGRSSVEFCDLFSRALRAIIHVKKYGGSSVLSHLFAQALVSGESFVREVEFRRQVDAHLPDSFKLEDPETAPVTGEYEVCIAVMSSHEGPLEIPFFSKVSLKYASKALGGLGYKVTKLKISQ